MAAAFQATLAHAQSTAPDFSICHVTVIDVVTGVERKDQTVVLRGNRIQSVAPSRPDDQATPGAFDAHGAYLIPGLWDMHVHVHSLHELPLYVANGVTGIRIMFGDKNTDALRAQLTGRSPSPKVYLASAIVDGSPPVWPHSIVVKKPADARRVVDEIKAGGADFVKVYNRIPRDTYFALADEARQQHIDFEGHVPYAVSAQEASSAGQRSIEHLDGIAVACSSRQEGLTGDLIRARYFRDRLAVEADALRTFSQPKCQDLFAEFRTHETWQCPTLTVLRVSGLAGDPRFTSDPRLAYIGRKSRDRWQERLGPQFRIWRSNMYEMARGIFSADEKLTGGLFRAGVPLIAGTDAMNPYCFPGFSLHDELALLVESGLTPLAALQAATINPARFMRRTDDFGSVEIGKAADLVLLRADPLADIRNTASVQAVWLDGKYYSRDELDGLLELAKKEARKN